MTYLAFHFVFLLPPIALLALYLRRARTTAPSRPWWPLPAIAAIAFAYTTPWDNYLVYRDVWGYGADRVLFTIGYVPIEEYLFFILQPILTGLWVYALLSRRPAPFEGPDRPLARRLATVTWVAITLLGVGLLLFAQPRGLYMGLILAWAAPVLAAMWAYGGRVLAPALGFMTIAVLPPTLYLWVADWTAMQLGIWHIADATSLGWDPLEMPIEEATFFLLTNVLCVQGLVLFLAGDVLARLRDRTAAMAR